MSTVSSSSDHLIEFKIAAYIYKTFTVVFLLVGTVTNLISAIVYSKKRMRKTSYAIYLFALAIVDLLVTLNGNVRLFLMSYEFDFLKTRASELHRATAMDTWHRQIFKGIDIRHVSLFACRSHRFSTYFLLEFSSIILSMLSIDRFFGCALVLKSSRFCKPSIASKAVVCSLAICFLFNFHFFIFMGYEEYVEVRDDDPLDALNDTNSTNINNFTSQLVKVLICEPNPHNYWYARFWEVYFYLDSAFYCIVPFLIMLFCNLSIITKIIKSRVNSKQVIVAKNKKNNSSILLKNKGNAMLAGERRISIILILISVSFLVLTAPVFIMENLDVSLYLAYRPQYEIGLSLAYMCMYANHVINFFFYCYIGPNFRNEARKLFPSVLCPRRKENRPGLLRANTCRGVSAAAVAARTVAANTTASAFYLPSSSSLHYRFQKQFRYKFRDAFIRRELVCSYYSSASSSSSRSLESGKKGMSALFHTPTTTTLLSLVKYNTEDNANNAIPNFQTSIV
jgi:hypothetical protein